ncbi:winged helix-turn-helix domain-containing protein [Rhizobium helianthi]|uniref:Winged helix-turn-helix domain-containing protein n=1 Tax=Rhizobium helianthi TaxID=1132695 RepID=A0ABW4M5L6_9HYPH
MTILFDNLLARNIFLDRQGLSAAPSRALGYQGLQRMIEDIGFVQIDSVQTVERAHQQILFSRNQTYRREDLTRLLEQERSLFEHWTHDASIIPSAFFAYWKHRFRRREPIILERWRRWQGEGFDAAFQQTLARIRDHGPVMSRDVKVEDHKSGGWWNWHPSKTALEFLWHTGHLAISRREGFQKVYDLMERVIAPAHYEAEVSEADFVDWACRSALERLGFATTGEIAAFWDLIKAQEAKAWVESHRDELQPVSIACVDGRQRLSFALKDRISDLMNAPEPPARLRVLSPFDPLLRDRDRAERLFGFNYRIEIFVPEPKRQYGYYVFPLLEGNRLIGRIDMKAERKAGVLAVKRLWLEPGVKLSTGRMARLEAELTRLARFTGVETVDFLTGWTGKDGG